MGQREFADRLCGTKYFIVQKVSTFQVIGDPDPRYGEASLADLEVRTPLHVGLDGVSK